MTEQIHSNKTHAILAVVAAFLAFAAGVWIIRADMFTWNIGVSHDSIFYLDAAKNMLRGLGIVNTVTGEALPMTHYPPFYPIVLAGISFVTGIEPIKSAYYLAMLLTGLNVVLIGYVTYKYASYSILAGITAAALALVSHTIITTHYMAWSEPLFLFLVLSGILLLDKYLRSGQVKFLLFTGILFALAIFTRYVGFILLPFAGLAILLFRRQSLPVHIKHILLVGLPSVILIGSWMLRNSLLTGKSTNRSIQFLGFGEARVTELKSTLMSWFFSGGSVSAGFNRTMLVLAVAIILLVFLYCKDLKHGIVYYRSKLAELMLLFGLMYLSFLIVSVSFVDASTPLDDRMLVPFFVALLCVFAATFWRAAQMLFPGKLFFATSAFLLLGFGWLGWKKYNYIQYFHNETRAHGNGFTSHEMRENDAAKAINNLPPAAQVYAPGFEYVYLYYLTGRPVKPFTDLENNSAANISHAFAAYLQPCCHQGNQPFVPAPFKAGEPVWGQHLYPILPAE